VKDHIVSNCPEACGKVKSMLSRVGDTWSVMVILALDGMGTMRFNELKRHLGISQRMLSLTLRELERDGMIKRTVYATVPARVEYDLTPLGEQFSDPIRVMGRWIYDHIDQIDQAREAYDAENPALAKT
jgi:DNA-binding HxlR family transcriptional regulator